MVTLLNHALVGLLSAHIILWLLNANANANANALV